MSTSPSTPVTFPLSASGLVPVQPTPPDFSECSVFFGDALPVNDCFYAAGLLPLGWQAELYSTAALPSYHYSLPFSVAHG